MKIAELIPVLQVAIGPVILISGVGLLLLSMTNRLGRAIDRARGMVESHHRAPTDERPRTEAQLDILWKRALLLRTAITLASISVLLAAVLIIVLFLTALLKVELAIIIVAIFVACMGAVIASLVFFIRDIDLSLRALSLELGHKHPEID